MFYIWLLLIFFYFLFFLCCCCCCFFSTIGWIRARSTKFTKNDTVFISSSWCRFDFLDYPSIVASINLMLKRRLNYTGVQVFVSQPNCKFCGLRLRWYWTTSHFWNQLVQSGTAQVLQVLKVYPKRRWGEALWTAFFMNFFLKTKRWSGMDKLACSWNISKMSLSIMHRNTCENSSCETIGEVKENPKQTWTNFLPPTPTFCHYAVFHNSLKAEHIAEENYARAENIPSTVWD